MTVFCSSWMAVLWFSRTGFLFRDFSFLVVSKMSFAGNL
jgi:hypothetical protein